MRKTRLTALAMAILLGTALPQKALAAEEDWREGNPLVAHAMGEADGKIETNSKEAFLSSWADGYRVVEADFTYTSDGVLVVRHDFEADGSYYRLEIDPKQPLQMDSQTFRETKAVYSQTPITAAELLGLMAEYTDMYVITDTKDSDEAAVKKQFGDLKAIAENMGAPEILNRIVPQIYQEEMLDWVKSVYAFPQWIFTLYQIPDPNYEEIALFCKEKGIDTVTIERSRLSKAVVDTFRGQQVQVYAHTVNRYKQLEELLAMGVSGIYTDRIKPYELEWVGLSNARRTGTQTVMIGETERTFTTLDIMGRIYVPLRQLGTVGKGFSAAYDGEKKILSLSSGKAFLALGNELLLEKSGRLITQKADFRLYLDETDTKIIPFLVDGEVYVPLEETMGLLLQ